MTSLTDEELQRLRPLAFTVAYRMLGSVADAEDVAQETLVAVAQTRELDNPDAFTTTVATRRSLDMLRSARVRREQYVGEWLPEPLVAPDQDPSVSAPAELAEDVSTAFLVLLQSLSPAERAAFVLHDVLDFGYPEIADTLHRSEPATRQLVTRARRHVASREPRFPDRPQRRHALVTRFLDACRRGTVDGFVDLLADDVIFTGDGGGNVPPGLAISQPVSGAAAVARLLVQFSPVAGLASLQPCSVNGQPGAAIRVDESLGGGLLAVLSIEVTADRISHIRSVINPDKLAHLAPLADTDRVAAEMRRFRRAAGGGRRSGDRAQ